jgi:uncharacterized protein (TIGR04255 family)
MDPIYRRFERPPIDEVVCSTQFIPLDQLRVPHFGLLWERFRDEYPECEDVAPLLGVIERPDGPVLEEPIGDASRLLPRVWFFQPSGPGLIQVQRDRFLVNWRKRGSLDVYPGFESVTGRFRRHLQEFETFLSEYSIGSPSMLQYELTYIDIIAQGEGWATQDDIPRVLPDLTWQSRAAGVFGEPEALHSQVAFALPQESGRLHVSVQLARRRSDGVPVLRLEFTARGMAQDSSRESMWGWFGLAHESIDRAFLELTSEEVQRRVWHRKD